MTATENTAFQTGISGSLSVSQSRKYRRNRITKGFSRRSHTDGARIQDSVLIDPACGSGNFLTETFLRLRELENRALGDRLHDQGYLELGGENSLVKVSIDQFYGIEINDFAVAVSKTALWIAEQQALDDTEAIAGQAMPHLPLHDSGNIVCANALRYDWNELLPGGECDYVMGNPPFIGQRLKSQDQTEDMRCVLSS